MRRRRAGLAAGVVILANGFVAATAGADEQRLTAAGVHVVAAALVNAPSGSPFAAVWSENASSGARLRVAFARPDGRFGASRVIVRTRLPIVTVGAAAAGRDVIVVAAHLRRGGGESVLAASATPVSSTPPVALGRGPVIGRPPSVAADARGNAIAAWQTRTRVVVARRRAGRWRRSVFRGATGPPAVAAATDGTDVALARGSPGTITAVRAPPGRRVGRATTFWSAPRRDIACCAIATAPGAQLIAAWGEGRRARVVAAAASGRPRTILSAATPEVIEAPPVAAVALDGEWTVGWCDVGGHAATALGAPGVSVDQRVLPRFRYAPLVAAAVLAGGATAFVASYFGRTDSVVRAAARDPLRPRPVIQGDPLGVALTPAGPVALIVRRAPNGDTLTAAPL